MKVALIRYKAKPDQVDSVKQAVREFIDAIRSVADPEVSYTSTVMDDGVSFVHFGRFKTEEALNRFRAAPHFKTFGGLLPTLCEEGPEATQLSQVATTDAQFDS